MLNSDKQLLIQNGAVIRCKLIVKATSTLPEIVLTEKDSIKDWVYTDDRYVPKQGFIGQFVARTLEGNLHNISEDFNIENREIELMFGVSQIGSQNEENVSWYSFGNFIVTSPENDEVKDNTVFEAMDYTKLFNKHFDYEYTDSTYTQSYKEIIDSGQTVTAIWLAKYACAQVGIDFPQETFTNSDFIISQNPFQAGESCRDVLKEISKLAYSWVRIGWDNKCYIDFEPQNDNSVDTYNIIDNNKYYTLETKKELYGPINNVVVGMSGIDGESHSIKDSDSITQYGEHTIYIYDNPLTNTFELREIAQRAANKLFGLSYTQLNVETIGHPWLQSNDMINALSMSGEDNFTYAFNKTITYNGHIRSTISSMGDSEIEKTLAYESDVLKNVKYAKINVDKHNGEILALVDTTNEIQKEINPTKNESGSYITIEDASDSPLIDLKIEGKSTQETRSGKNILKSVNTAVRETFGITFTPNDDGSITINGTATDNAYFTVNGNYSDSSKNSYFTLEKGQTYTSYLGNNNVSGIRMATRTKTQNLPFLNTGYASEIGVQTYTGETDTQAYAFIDVRMGTTLNNFTVYPMIIKGSYTLDTIGEFEKYGVSPSPDYPSEIESVGYSNLFDKENITTSYYVEFTTGELVYNTGRFTTDYIPVKSNSNYVISGAEILHIAYFDENKNYLSGVRTIGTITTPNNASYVRFSPLLTELDTTQIVKGTKQHSYIPYGKYGIEVEATNGTDSNTSIILLNKPLRSLPNGVKDIAYIRNNKLYVDRYVGSDIVTLTGGLLTLSNGVKGIAYRTTLNKIEKQNNNAYCSRALINGSYQDGTAYENPANFVFVGNSEDTLETLKEKYDNSELLYELAEPYTEDYGEMQMPSTFKGINHVTTTDKLLPTINLTYTTNTLITNYVEKHIAKLKISDDEIRTKVSSVDEFATSLGSSIDSELQEIGKNFNNYVPTSEFVTLEKSVESLQTDTYTKTEINTKLTDGSVTKVSTVSGTFDENGMHYEKTNAPTSSTINEKGVEVDSTTTGAELLFAGYDEELKQTIVRTENLTVRKYFIVGDNSRIENYGNGGGIFII